MTYKKEHINDQYKYKITMKYFIIIITFFILLSIYKGITIYNHTKKYKENIDTDTQYIYEIETSLSTLLYKIKELTKNISIFF
jgi:sensor domain CHASE-containing protein